jgi:hypothetical protein
MASSSSSSSSLASSQPSSSSASLTSLRPPIHPLFHSTPGHPPTLNTQHQQTKKLNKRFAAQRAHANFIENQPSALGALLISGLHFPVAAAVLGATWSVGRTLYLYGYTSSAGPKGRTL